MRTKKIFLGFLITALILTVVLVSIKAYYVAIALVAGTLLIGHREFWSLVARRKLPPFDERVRENINKSVRNGFIFFALALAFLMLPFSTTLVTRPDTVHILGGLLVSGGVAYLLSYIFYDRSEPNLSKRRLKMLKIFLMVAGISLAVFIISVFLHNALSALFGVEEPVFFFIAVFIAPSALAVGLIGSLVLFVQGLLSKAS